MQAVIFDMDGVIFDTEHLAMRLWIQAAQELGIPGIAEVYPSVIGTTTVRTHEILTERYGVSFPWEAFDGRIRDLYHEHYEREGLPVKPGVPELLSSLCGNLAGLCAALHLGRFIDCQIAVLGLMLSALITAYVFSLKRLLEARFRLGQFSSVCLALLFLLLHCESEYLLHYRK